jgi:putative glutamine amidotransferase
VQPVHGCTLFVYHLQFLSQIVMEGNQSPLSAPLIGLSTAWSHHELEDHSLETNQYARVIAQCGGNPVFIPTDLSPRHLSKLFSTCSGILLRGGGDIDPTRYVVLPSNLTHLKEIKPERDALEVSLILLAIESKKPLLGICRGIQIMNVALGGSLYQDLTVEVRDSFNHDQHKYEDHTDKPRDLLIHLVALSPDSLLAKAIGKTELRVNSLHHQGIKTLSSKLKATGTVPEDGLIEAVELPRHPFFIGVQWHPEELTKFPDHMSIFQEFINQSARFGGEG